MNCRHQKSKQPSKSENQQFFKQYVFTYVKSGYFKLDFEVEITSGADRRSADLTMTFIDKDFVLPLEDGQHMIFFKALYKASKTENFFSCMSCLDRHGRLLNQIYLPYEVERKRVARYGPSEFIISHFFDRAQELRVYNSALECVRKVGTESRVTEICCNDKYVFGIFWVEINKDELGPMEKSVSSSFTGIVQVRHLRTLEVAFYLTVDRKYKLKRIMADEHHCVAFSTECPSKPTLQSQLQSYMHVFELSGKCGKSVYFAAERLVHMDTQSIWVNLAFLRDDWLVIPHQREIVWLDKNGQRSDTSTEFHTLAALRAVRPSGLSLQFALSDIKLASKQS